VRNVETSVSEFENYEDFMKNHPEEAERYEAL